MSRRLTLVAVVVGAFFALAMIRVVLEARSEFSEAEAALSKAHTDEAITHYRRAIQWYLPANPYVERAIDRLGELAQQAERNGNRALALRAWRDLRGALYSVRSFYQPHRETVRRAEVRIAKLMAGLPKSSSQPTTADNERRSRLEAKYLTQLRRDYAPSPWWSALMVIGFLAWVGSAVAMIVRGFDAEGRLVGHKAWPWALAIVVGLALWMVSLRLA